MCPWNPASYLTPLVNEIFDLVPQGSKHLKPRLSSVSLNSTILLWFGQVFLVLPTAQVEENERGRR